MNEQFEYGDRVEFCGEEATVLRCYSRTVEVRDDAGNVMVWYVDFQGTPVTSVRKNTRQTRERRVAQMLDTLKNFDVRRMAKDDLIELSAHARMYIAEFKENGIDVPEWLDVNTKSLRRELASRIADEKDAKLRSLKAQRAGLRTTEEKRAELDRLIAEMEGTPTSA